MTGSSYHVAANRTRRFATRVRLTSAVLPNAAEPKSIELPAFTSDWRTTSGESLTTVGAIPNEQRRIATTRPSRPGRKAVRARTAGAASPTNRRRPPNVDPAFADQARDRGDQYHPHRERSGDQARTRARESRTWFESHPDSSRGIAHAGRSIANGDAHASEQPRLRRERVVANPEQLPTESRTPAGDHRTSGAESRTTQLARRTTQTL